MSADENQSHSRLILIHSVVILGLLGLQAATSFRFFCPPEQLNWFPLPLRICDPELWPFLSYPMYNQPHYLGEQLNRPRIVGTLEDDSQVLISFKDLGLTVTQFINLYDELKGSKDLQRAQLVAQLYYEKTDRKLNAIQLANHPTVFTKTGFVPSELQIIQTFTFNTTEMDE